MKNWLLARALFWSATIAALLLYWLTVPDGLPWNASSHWAALLTNGTAAEEMPPVSLWSYFVLVFGGHHVALACVAAAFAAGFVAVVAFRIFGWRVAVGAALAWMFAPWVWNRAVTGEWLGFAASVAVFVAWLGVVIAFRATRKARDVWPGEVEDVLWLQLDQTLKPEKTNRLVMWSPVAAGGLFALVSLYVHDYRLGEPASAYARGVVDAVEFNTRHLVELVLQKRASSVILAHNHLSGIALPSEEDDLTTLRLSQALALVGVSLNDHIIIAGCEYVSMAECGTLR